MGDSTADTASTPNFGPLEGTYQILGELRDSRRTRTYIARRRSDGGDVTVSVYAPPSNERPNELPHYAADVKLLAGVHHPHLVTPIEARWTGPSLAVVSERIKGETLGDRLGRGERFPNPRIAAILDEVYGLLEWARARGVVHRGVPLDHLFFEEETQRVMVAFAPTVIPISGVPDAGADVRTIGTLAWAMLAGEPYGVGGKRRRLTELAPDLASRVVDAVEKLMGSAGAENGMPDIRGTLAVIASGDVLKQAEVEMAALREEYHEKHRAELASCERHRAEVEQQAAEAASALAADRSALEERMAAREAALTDGRADLDRVMVERQQQLSAVRAELEAQAAELERRLEEYDARRRQLENVVMVYQKRIKAFEAARGAGGRGAVAGAREPLDPAALPVMQPVGFRQDRKREKSHKAARTQLLANLDGPVPVRTGGGRPPRKRWVIPSVVGAMCVALAAGVIVAREQAPDGVRSVKIGNTTVVPPTGGIERGRQSRGGFLSQSAGGGVVPEPVGAPYAKPGDSVTARRPDSAQAEDPAPRSRPKPREPASDAEGMPAPPVRRVAPEPAAAPVVVPLPALRESVSVPDTAPRDTMYGRIPPVRDTVRVRDSSFGKENVYRVDTIVKRDSIIVPGAWDSPPPRMRRDTSATGRDSASPVRRDTSVKRGTIIRPEAGVVPPRR